MQACHSQCLATAGFGFMVCFRVHVSNHEACSYQGEFLEIALQNLTQIPDMA